MDAGGIRSEKGTEIIGSLPPFPLVHYRLPWAT